jgi:ubiquinone/menaquinone biosynthesis C-methylase UbiE
MANASPLSSYFLGSTDSEHERLCRQAALLAPFTERLFRDAGLAAGQRVLDIGSGAGDVALLAARLVGENGQVVGVDRDTIALTKARMRALEAGIKNVKFIEGDISELTAVAPFDAVIGRFILQFMPDPMAVLRTLAALTRPGGVIVFQESHWTSFLALTAHLPLRIECGKLIIEALRRASVSTDMDLVLFRGFQEVGFPPPKLRLETPVGHDSETRRWIHDLFCTVYPRLAQLGISHESLGDLATLSVRLDDELNAMNSYAACVGLVGAWARKGNHGESGGSPRSVGET